jgi:sugar phosphate isomerase/epimerase
MTEEEETNLAQIRQPRMKYFTRRRFVQSALLASAGVALAAENSGPRADFPLDPRARLAVATYPFRASMTAPGNHDRDPQKPGMDLAQFSRFIRTNFGVQGIEPLDSHFASTEAGEIRKLRAAFDAAGVHTVNIPVDARVELCSDDPATRDAGNAVYRHWVDIAVLLASPSIRVWIPKCRDRSDLAKAVSALKPTIDYAASRNVAVNLENDDPVTSSEARVLAALQLAATPYLRALPDFGNSLALGDEQFNAGSVQRMFAHAWNIAHVKDAETFKGERRTASLAPLFAIAKAAHYRGYYSMESDSDVDPFVDTRHLIEQSLSLM